MFDMRKLSAGAGALALVMSSSGAHAQAAAPQAGLQALVPLVEMQVAMLSPVFANLCLGGAQGCVLPLRSEKPPVAAPLPSAPPPVSPAPAAAGGAAAGGGIGSFWLLGALSALVAGGLLIAGNGDDSPGG